MRISSAAILFVTFLSLNALARHESNGHKLLRHIKAMAMKCVAHPYQVNEHGEKTYLNPRVLCPQIELVDLHTAKLWIDNQELVAVLKENEDSDGGDLDRLLIFNSEGQLVAQKLNVLAFDHILLGLIDGRSDLVEVLEGAN